MAIVTRDSLQAMLNNENDNYVEAVIGRALIVLLNNQTQDEQNDNTTKINNGIGFTGADAYSGSLTAKYYIKHKRLTAWMIEKWIKPNKHGYARLTKYHGQLNTAAKN